MITSTSNQKIKNVRALLSSKRERRRQGLYVIEGIKLFEEAPSDKIKEVYVSESFIAKYKNEKLEAAGYITVTDTVFSKMSDTVTPQGILCVLSSENQDIKKLCGDFSGQDLQKGDKGLHIIVLEGLQDPGNLGTIIRTAEAAGFDFIIADNSTADIYSPKVIRSTMGSIFRIPVAYTDDLCCTVGYLKQQGITVYAAHLNGDQSYRDVDYGNRCAILIGNEGNGLSDKITDSADGLVKIPMHGSAESLNAAVAAALLMYEATARM